MTPTSDPPNDSSNGPPGPPVVYVDLDGTLIRSDVLWESVALLARQKPLGLLAAPVWLIGGRARLKDELARRVSVDPSALPYCPDVLALIAEARASGRRVVLATATARPVAEAIAAHLGVFDGVLATADGVNLKGAAKLAAIRADAGGPFEYWGDGPPDVAVFEAADAYVIVRPGRSVTARTRRLPPARRVIPRPGGRGRDALRALRPHQWVKNLLVFLPAFASHTLFDPAVFAACVAAFLVFSLLASGHYVLNDLLDLSADRLHSHKQSRPFASGALPIPVGVGLSLGLTAAAAAVAVAATPPPFWAWAGGYFLLTNVYSFDLKKRLLVDVLALASLYTIRILAGGAATGIVVSEWLLAFSMFLFTSLAFVKRFTELRNLDLPAAGGTPGPRAAHSGRAYQAEDLDIIRTVGPTTGYMAVLVLSLYVQSTGSVKLYRHPELLWLVCPLVAYWVTRVWFLANRGHLHHDPVVFALRDGRSRLVAAAVAALMVLAT